MHTPGPWTICYLAAKDTEDGHAETAIQAYADENGEEGATIATVNRWRYYDDPPTPESDANASLIAAAPDLLAALKDVRDNVSDDSPEMWARVENAIAKAEGRS